LTKINVRDVSRRDVPVALILTGTVFVLLPVVLPVVLRDLGDRARARPLFERALAITESPYGPDHLVVGNI